jgi:BNR/Asp-box repeat
MIRSLLRLSLLFSFAAAVFAQRPGDFKIVGPGGGGAMFRPQVSPHDPNTVLVACDMTGAYITHDGGKSWRMFNLRGVAEFFVFDPTDKNVIYVKSTGLWRSQDNGETWKLIYPKPNAVKGIEMSSDHSDEDILAAPDPLGNISAMAIDPDNSKVLYAAAGDRTKGPFGLYISRDAGESWSKLSGLTGAALKVFVNLGVHQWSAARLAEYNLLDRF